MRGSSDLRLWRRAARDEPGDKGQHGDPGRCGPELSAGLAGGHQENVLRTQGHPLAADTARTDTLVARQPIFDLKGTVVGYELLYREDESELTTCADRNTMSARTIGSAIVDIGLADLVGSTRAWINVTESSLVSDDWSLLSSAACVVEVLETVPVTPETIGALQRLRAAGFEIALDDFVDSPEFEPFLALARVVKLDVLEKNPAEMAAAVRGYKARGLTVVAERIETVEMYEACRLAGFDLFQGYYFARPELVQGLRVSPQVGVLAQAINRLAQEEVNLRDLEQVFRGDPTLTFKLLRISNSASLGNGGVDSVRKAIALVGRTALQRWMAVLLAACGPQTRGEDGERLRVALERARFVELITERVDPRRTPAAFLSGLLSMLDVVLGVPLDEVLSLVNVSDEVRLALLDRLGPLAGPILLAESLELGLFESARAEAEQMGVTDEVMRSAMLDAARWTRGMRAAVS